MRYRDDLIRSYRCYCGNPKPVGWTACAVHGGLPVGPQPVLNINAIDPDCPLGIEVEDTKEGLRHGR